jgi:hypothetical protein
MLSATTSNLCELRELSVMAYGITNQKMKAIRKRAALRALRVPKDIRTPEFIRRMCIDKVRYKAEGDAVAILSVICGKRNGRPGRAYKCPHCDGFHITSKLR